MNKRRRYKAKRRRAIDRLWTIYFIADQRWCLENSDRAWDGYRAARTRLRLALWRDPFG